MRWKIATIQGKETNALISDEGYCINRLSGIEISRTKKITPTNAYYSITIGVVEESPHKQNKFHLVYRPIALHELIATNFIGPKPELYEVNHKDRNGLNNSADNLEWISHRDNIYHYWKTDRIKLTSGLPSKTVTKICEMLSEGKWMYEIVNKTKVPVKIINQIRLYQVDVDISKEFDFRLPPEFTKMLTPIPFGFDVIGTTGSSHYLTKLTDEQVHSICKLFETTKLSNKEIGEMMNVSWQIIASIRCGNAWKHISSNYKFHTAIKWKSYYELIFEMKCHGYSPNQIVQILLPEGIDPGEFDKIVRRVDRYKLNQLNNGKFYPAGIAKTKTLIPIDQKTLSARKTEAYQKFIQDNPWAKQTD